MRKGIGVRAAAAIGAPWCCVLVATLFVALSGGTFTPSASAAPQKPECADRIDNDGDGLVDFARSEGDPGCASRQDASERGTLVCDNGADDDADARTDYPGDPGCSSATDDSELGTTACDNGFDDDLDTYHDMRDVGCDDPADASEKGASVCDDGNDDDGDGSSDYPLDHGCTGPWDDSELGSTACDDGIDNDGDGRVDFDGGPGGGQPDPQCTTSWRSAEKSSSCGLGFEVALLAPLALRGRRLRRALAGRDGEAPR
jgi:hypothetical protein